MLWTGAMNHGVYSIGAIMPFPLGIYSISIINHAFSIGVIFKHSLKSYVLLSISHICDIWKQPLKGVPWNMCSIKLGKADTLNKDTD